jgi:undecaprenyl-diphosphatase
MSTTSKSDDFSTTVESISAPGALASPAATIGSSTGFRLLLIFELFFVATLAISLATMGANVLSVDVRVSRWVQQGSIPFEGILASFGNRAGSATVAVPTAIAVAGLFAAFRRIPASLVVLLALAARALNTPLKELFESPRPTSDFVKVTESAIGYGFPSGHSMGAMLLCGSIAVGVALSFKNRWISIAIFPVGLFVVLATGLGRIYTGAHWPSDVLGGYLWGASLLIVTSALALRLSEYIERKRRHP